MSKLAIRMKAMRARLNIKQHELSEKSGVSRETIAKIECGATEWPSRENVVKLAEALQTSPWYLLFGVIQTIDDMDADVIDAARVLQSLPDDKRKLMTSTIKLVASQ